MGSTGERAVSLARRRGARVAAALLAALLLGACGGDDGPALDLGPIREGGAQDGGTADGSKAKDAGAKTEGGVALGDLANLSVSWTIDGASDNPAALCAKYNVGYFALVVRVDAPGGSEVLSKGVMCATGSWNTGEELFELPYGPYAVTLTAASGTCCSGGATVAVGGKKLWLKKGTSTDVVLNLADGRFVPLP